MGWAEQGRAGQGGEKSIVVFTRRPRRDAAGFVAARDFALEYADIALSWIVSSILRKKIKSRRRMRFLQIFVNDELSDVFDYEIISHPRRRMLWPFKIFKY